MHGTRPEEIPLSRRALLRSIAGSGLAAAGVLAGTGLAGGLVLKALRPKVAGLAVLDAAEYQVAAALAEAHLPEGGAIPQGAAAFDLARGFDGYLKDEPEDNVRDLRGALTLVEIGPYVFEHRPGLFSRLPAEEQRRHWATWASSPFAVQRQVYLGFRKIFSILFYDQPKVWPHIGYAGPGGGGSGVTPGEGRR